MTFCSNSVSEEMWTPYSFWLRERIRSASDRYKREVDLRTCSLRHRQILQGKRRPNSTVVEVYGMALEALRRALNVELYPEQIMAAVALMRNSVVEMQTGEGKTFASVLPVVLNAMHGRGCHVITANQYLAERDARALAPVYSMLGLTVGVISDSLAESDRCVQYTKDITYSTAAQIGFDFLRDELRTHPERSPCRYNDVGLRAQRSLFSAVIDEADHILLDEARTPLLIASEKQPSTAFVRLLRWAATQPGKLIDGCDYRINPQLRQATLTTAGSQKILLGQMPVVAARFTTEELFEAVENAIAGSFLYLRDRHYIVDDNEIIIIDEGTGRRLTGRKWQKGMHQAIQAKERLEFTGTTETAARMTIQSLFRKYHFLSGLTGTAWSVRSELSRTYGLRVRRIPTHMPCRRKKRPTSVFETRSDKWDYVVSQTSRVLASQRAVLIGTSTVEDSQELSRIMTTAGIRHETLNAVDDAREAEIVASAGKVGSVTIATNMAGRGTDIVLEETVRLNGGLHVIATEIHESRRVDRQLQGRAARQGDPGSYEFAVSLEDAVAKRMSSARKRTLLRRYRSSYRSVKQLEKKILRQQRRLEKRDRRARTSLMKKEEAHSEVCSKLGVNRYLELIHDD